MNVRYQQLEMDEIEINVKSILKQCRKKSRIIVITILLFTILVPSVLYCKDILVYKNAMSENEIIMVEEGAFSDENLTEKEKRDIEEYYLLESRYKQLAIYEEKSPILKLDYRNVYQGELQYYIDADISIKADIARVIYNYTFTQTFFDQYASKTKGLESIYAYEIVNRTISDGDNGVLRVCVFAENEELCKEYIKAIDETIKEYSTLLQDTMEKHTLKVVQENISVGVVSDILETQKSFYNHYREAETQLNSFESSLSDTQKAIIRMSGEDKVAEIKTNKPTFNVVYIILGIILGAVVGVAVVAISVMFGGKLQTEKELQKRLNVSHFGTITIGKKLNKDDDNQMDNEKLELICAKIKALMKKENDSYISLIGTTQKIYSDYIESICSILEKDNIKCEIIGNIVDEKDTLDRINVENKFILVESIGESIVEKIYVESQICKDMNMDVLGYICFYE